MVWQVRIKGKKTPLYAQIEPFETQYEPPFAPQIELVVKAQNNSSDTENLGSTTESESNFEESDYSVEDIEEVVQPLFTDASCRNQFRTHFEKERDASEIRLYRTRDFAIELIEGKHKQQYDLLYDYLGELRLTNPGTTTICKLDDRVFERVYICIEACKDGFKAGCRPIIYLDGCHLNGYHKGHLLAAIGIDANDCLYPITFAAVEIRGQDQWARQTYCEPILPPTLRRPSGRPHKNRKEEEVDEPIIQGDRVTKKGVTMTCTKCKRTRHNVRTCKGIVGGNSNIRPSSQASSSRLH
ncbi:hypothetical protein V6N13_135189 [Hibiscus sabdariffa]